MHEFPVAWARTRRGAGKKTGRILMESCVELFRSEGPGPYLRTEDEYVLGQVAITRWRRTFSSSSSSSSSTTSDGSGGSKDSGHTQLANWTTLVPEPKSPYL